MHSLATTVKVQEAPETGDLFLPIPDAWLEALDWRLGDAMKWSKRSSGDWELTNLTKAERDRLVHQTEPSKATKGSKHGRSRHDPTD